MPDPTLQKAGEAYLEHLRVEGKSERTIYTYSRDLDLVNESLGAETKLSALTPARIGKFLKSDNLAKLPNGKPRGERTVQKVVRVLRMLLVWAKATGRLEALPLPKDLPMGRSVVPEIEGEGGSRRRSTAAGPAGAGQE